MEIIILQWAIFRGYKANSRTHFVILINQFRNQYSFKCWWRIAVFYGIPGSLGSGWHFHVVLGFNVPAVDQIFSVAEPKLSSSRCQQQREASGQVTRKPRPIQSGLGHCPGSWYLPCLSRLLSPWGSQTGSQLGFPMGQRKPPQSQSLWSGWG